MTAGELSPWSHTQWPHSGQGAVGLRSCSDGVLWADPSLMQTL